MKHIFLFIDKERSAAYGRGTYIQQMVKCLQDSKNISLNIVQFFAGNKEFDVVIENNVHVYSFPFKNIQPSLLSRYYRNCWYILKNYIKLTSKDHVIFHLNFIREFELIKFMRKDYPLSKIFFTLHFQEWASTLQGNVDYYKRIIKKGATSSNTSLENEVYLNYVIEKQSLEEVDKIVCLSKFTERLLIENYTISADKVLLIYNGLEDDFIVLNEKEKEQLKKRLFIPVYEKIILFVGRLDSSKGLDILINAFKEVIALNPECRLVIVGDGNFAEYLKMAKDLWNKIVFTGWLPKEDLCLFYQVADIAVLPSVHEQCSYVAIEMMGFKLPIISSPAYGLREMIDLYDNGIIVETREKEDQMLISSHALGVAILEALKIEKSKNIIMPSIYKLENTKINYLNLYSEHS
ncbi:D-inositol-3-phosphate glycosyltransferase [bioreactor metagenome]|uniref:D-inositol-3-phosphate glycosyltransferase n=1 Tax=bioreactor metagenome TaxID=1076179 RepID=A0A644WXQ0_9ZZZZ